MISKPVVVDVVVSSVVVVAAAANGYSENCRCFPVTWSAAPVAPWGRLGK